MSENVESLRAELAAVRRSESQLRELLAAAHEQLAERDDEMVYDLIWESREGQRRVEEMRQTRLWRMGTAYWTARDRLLGRLRPGRGR